MRISLIGGLLVVMSLAAGMLSVLNWAAPPDLSRFHDRSVVVSDSAGAPLRIFLSKDDKWRLATRPRDVDPLYLRMLQAYEDKRFRQHWGVDPLAVARAAGQAATAGRFVSGAATLTMQAARLLEPQSRTLTGKAIEAWLALQLESRLAKDEVLSIYLTLAPMGGAVEGVRAASLKLFGREPNLLTPAEAALLVALPQSPNARRPDRNPARARAARAWVLARVAEAGVITAKEASAANAAPLPTAYRPMAFKAPHLAEELAGEADSQGAVATTLDGDLQAKVERRLAAITAAYPPPVSAAAIVVNANTAAVRALVGSPGYFDRKRAGMVDMSRAVRSPGSSLKPFVYGLAFDRLLATPDTLIGDRPFREGGYAPANFDGGYAGDVSAAEALVRSLNIPAVKVLRRLGAARFDAALATAGIGLAFDRGGGDPGLALALGGVGTDLRDLARAYVAIAGGGAIPDRLALTPDAKVAWRTLFGADTAAELRAILAEAAPPSGRAERRLPYKTGTSYGFRDAVAIGVKGEFVIGVWVGRPDNGACSGCVGRIAAAPAVFDIADALPDAPTPVRALGRTPAHLRHFDHPNLGSAPATLRPVAIQFPADGSELRLGRSGAAPLVATGGRPPYRWLVDGAPAGAAGVGEIVAWRPGGPGFHRVSVVDENGISASIQVIIGKSR